MNFGVRQAQLRLQFHHVIVVLPKEGHLTELPSSYKMQMTATKDIVTGAMELAPFVFSLQLPLRLFVS